MHPHLQASPTKAYTNEHAHIQIQARTAVHINTRTCIQTDRQTDKQTNEQTTKTDSTIL